MPLLAVPRLTSAPTPDTASVPLDPTVKPIPIPPVFELTTSVPPNSTWATPVPPRMPNPQSIDRGGAQRQQRGHAAADHERANTAGVGADSDAAVGCGHLHRSARGDRHRARAAELADADATHRGPGRDDLRPGAGDQHRPDSPHRVTDPDPATDPVRGDQHRPAANHFQIPGTQLPDADPAGRGRQQTAIHRNRSNTAREPPDADAAAGVCGAVRDECPVPAHRDGATSDIKRAGAGRPHLQESRPRQARYSTPRPSSHWRSQRCRR